MGKNLGKIDENGTAEVDFEITWRRLQPVACCSSKTRGTSIENHWLKPAP
jgi:hypothetical protein